MRCLARYCATRAAARAVGVEYLIPLSAAVVVRGRTHGGGEGAAAHAARRRAARLGPFPPASSRAPPRDGGGLPQRAPGARGARRGRARAPARGALARRVCGGGAEAARGARQGEARVRRERVGVRADGWRGQSCLYAASGARQQGADGAACALAGGAQCGASTHLATACASPAPLQRTIGPCLSLTPAPTALSRPDLCARSRARPQGCHRSRRRGDALAERWRRRCERRGVRHPGRGRT